MTASRERFDVEAERRTLGAMTAGELRRRYQEVGGDEARSRNREYLIRRILWMLQAVAYGGLSARAAGLADGLAREFDVRATPPRTRDAAFKAHPESSLRGRARCAARAPRQLYPQSTERAAAGSTRNSGITPDPAGEFAARGAKCHSRWYGSIYPETVNGDLR